MRIPRVFCPNLQAGPNVLDEDEAHHVVRVLRLDDGDRVCLFDGLGHEAHGRIDSITRAHVTVVADAMAPRPFDLRFRLTLAVAMTKAHRQSYLVEKCTELGVAALWPLLCERSVVQPADAAVDKWSRRAVEACKQSGRAWVPAVESPQPVDRAIARRGEFAISLTAVPGATRGLHDAFRPLDADTRILIFVGPEGGWTPAELSAFSVSSIEGVALSPTVLRTETAAVAICAAIASASRSRRSAI